MCTRPLATAPLHIVHVLWSPNWLLCLANGHSHNLYTVVPPPRLDRKKSDGHKYVLACKGLARPPILPIAMCRGLYDCTCVSA
ncbi:hypothetical protein C8R48DRAFT_698610 [Suillus tomentosus]|nr:hypothetical protein C8R48DRAFT_698610 [Suillus tomentosus]